MRNRLNLALTLLATGLYWGNAHAQDVGAPSPATQAPAPGKQASAKDKNKPPANTPDAPAPNQNAAPAAPPPDQSATPDAPPASTPKKPSTAADNPFPEDLSRQAAAAATADANASAPSTKQSPGSASQGSSSLDGLDKLGLDDGSRTRLKLESPDGTTDVYDPKRATEDVRVGKYYMKTADYKGAYDRFKDATLYDHEDAEAVFWLAEAARKMNLPQEATQNYEVYLAAVPDGPNAKLARKALGELGTAGKPSDQRP